MSEVNMKGVRVRNEHSDSRDQLIAIAQRMKYEGLNQGTSGNLSVRIPGGMIITPSSLSYDLMAPNDLVAIDFKGQALIHNTRRPSSEWRLHADILTARPEVQAVLHCHPIHSTALACHHREFLLFTTWSLSQVETISVALPMQHLVPQNYLGSQSKHS